MPITIIRNDIDLNFVGWRKIAYALSAAIILISLGFVFLNGGIKFGIDFAGGANAHLRFTEGIEDEALKSALAESGLPGLVIQRFGEGDTEYLIRISVTDENASTIREVLAKQLNDKLPGKSYEVLSLETVGAKVGADLRTRALEAMFYATLLIAVYVSGRFERRWFTAAAMAVVLGGGMYCLELFAGVSKLYLIPLAVFLTVLVCWRLRLVFALGAIISILHDVLITVGVFAVLGKEFDLTIIGALLTTIGYSLNDTIVVYDRIRENLPEHKNSPIEKVVNLSINQTLSRTVLTSGTTLLVILCLLIWGGGAIFDFALVMFIGVMVGTFSSIFVASPILLAFNAEDIRRSTPQKKKELKRGEDGRIAPQV